MPTQPHAGGHCRGPAEFPAGADGGAWLPGNVAAESQRAEVCLKFSHSNAELLGAWVVDQLHTGPARWAAVTRGAAAVAVSVAVRRARAPAAPDRAAAAAAVAAAAGIRQTRRVRGGQWKQQ